MTNKINENYHGGSITEPNFIGTTSTGTFFLTPTRELVDTKIIYDVEGTIIEIIYKIKDLPSQSYTSISYLTLNPKQKVLKERWGVINGKLQLIKSIQGYEEPAYYVPAKFKWEE